MRTRVLVADNTTLKGHHFYYLLASILAFRRADVEVYVYTNDNTEVQLLLAGNNLGEGILYIQPKLQWFDRISFALNRWRKGREFAQTKANYRLIKSAVEKTKVDLVFFNHLDSVIFPIISYQFLERIGVKWAGICIRPSSQAGFLKKELLSRYTTLKTCKTILILDELLFSDVTSETKLKHLPELNFSLGIHERSYNDLVAQKDGRILVSIIGSMVPKKGLRDFLEFATRLDSKKFVVLLVGLIPWHHYSEEGKQACLNCVAQLKEQGNLIFNEGYIKTEQHFNALYKASDIVWLAYKDHPYTSNAVIKAIQFRTRVITNKESLYIRMIADRYNYPFLLSTELTPERVQDLLSRQFDEKNLRRFSEDFSFEKYQQIIASSLD